MQSIRLEVQHGVIVVGDREGPAPPTLDGRAVAASDSTLAVATLHEVDGEALIQLAPTDEASDRPTICAHRGAVSVPTGRFCVCTTADEVVLEAAVPPDTVAVTVWINDERNPDRILIEYG